MDFKKTFLEFTEYTIPFGYEEKLIPLLKKYVPNLQQDSVGNYFTQIGDSETLFTTHLDTYSKKYKKVNHVIDGDWIGTDGTTILGGDNKNGLIILLYLIDKNIPGTYYFFIGEEPILSGGLYGSSNILRTNPEFFKKFKRAIAFDRKQTGSIVTRQLARFCCSNEFADYLIEEFRLQGIEFKKDPNAYYTDTAAFLNTIPEITNISAGGWGEHTKNEKTLITYTESVAIAASNINWENLPVVRKPFKVTTLDKIKKFENINKDFKKTKENFNHIEYLMDFLNFICLNKNEFNIGIDMIYSHWHKDIELSIKIINDDIYLDDKLIGNFYDFKKFLGIKFEKLIDIEYLLNNILSLRKDEISKNEMNNFLIQYHVNSDELIDYMKKNDYINNIIKFDNNKFKIL